MTEYFDITDYEGKSFDELQTARTNYELEQVVDELNKQLANANKPTGIVDRVFVDLLGAGVLYFLLFTVCDITRSIITGGDFYGFKWLVWGPYYYFTGAPIMTRIWKSKKFLEDLSEAKNEGLEYDPSRSCLIIGEAYNTACQIDTNSQKHPVRDKIGDTVGWVIEHTIGKAFGGLLGNATCSEQGTTISRDCSTRRAQEIYACYLFFCSQYTDINPDHVATDYNWPNSVADGAAVFNNWNVYEKTAYKYYHDAYCKIFDIGSGFFGQTGEPNNLYPFFDNVNYYAYNVKDMYLGGVSNQPVFSVPPWWTAEATPLLNGTTQQSEEFIRYFQDHYLQHTLDFWDPV